MMRSLFILLVMTGSAVAQTSQYNTDLYRRALDDVSTSPEYVLITVVNPVTKTKREICTPANLLIGALHLEHNIECNDSGEKQVKKLALEQPNRTFTFTKKTALDNLGNCETPEILIEIRQFFATKTEDQLLDRNFINSPLDFRTYLPQKESEMRYKAYHDAIAHALLERGIGCRMDDRTGLLRPHK